MFDTEKVVSLLAVIGWSTIFEIIVMSLQDIENTIQIVVKAM
jgi:hypothetical protein